MRLLNTISVFCTLLQILPLTDPSTALYFCPIVCGFPHFFEVCSNFDNNVGWSNLVKFSSAHLPPIIMKKLRPFSNINKQTVHCNPWCSFVSSCVSANEEMMTWYFFRTNKWTFVVGSWLDGRKLVFFLCFLGLFKSIVNRNRLPELASLFKEKDSNCVKWDFLFHIF